MEEQKQIEVHIFEKAINKYIDLLNSQMEAFPIIMNTLVARLKACGERMNDFMKKNNINQTTEGDTITIAIPQSLSKQFVRHNTELGQSLSAIQLIPQNVVVAFVSIYDAFVADIIEGIYNLCPKLLDSCEREYKFSDIIKYGSIENIKEQVIEKEVETVLRESHAKQFDWLSNKIKIKLTEDLPNYDAFIEITERRNLFVHTRGKVSRQYLSAISEKYKVNENGEKIKIGDTLEASSQYVIHCYNILFEIGVKLGQVIWRKLDEKRQIGHFAG